MCGRFVQDADQQELALRFEIDRVARLDPERRRYNIAPTDAAAVVRLDAEGRRELTMLRWGLVPAWKKDRDRAPINARAEGSAGRGEGIERSRFFGPAFQRRRCLVPARGFYEWGGEAGRRRPYLVAARDGALMALAGLWERNPRLAGDGGAAPLETFAVVTTAPNDLIGAIHDRMAVILPPEAWATWLDPRADLETLRALLVPFPSAALRVVPVSRSVNDVRNDDARLVEPVGPPLSAPTQPSLL